MITLMARFESIQKFFSGEDRYEKRIFNFRRSLLTDKVHGSKNTVALGGFQKKKSQVGCR